MRSGTTLRTALRTTQRTAQTSLGCEDGSLVLLLESPRAPDSLSLDAPKPRSRHKRWTKFRDAHLQSCLGSPGTEPLQEDAARWCTTGTRSVVCSCKSEGLARAVITRDRPIQRADDGARLGSDFPPLVGGGGGVSALKNIYAGLKWILFKHGRE